LPVVRLTVRLVRPAHFLIRPRLNSWRVSAAILRPLK
jgi:hypothetical protein